MKTNIAKKLSKLINCHFPKHHLVSKIVNKNTIKLSHSCCGNIGSVIASHNRRIIHPITMDAIVEIELNTHVLMIVFTLYANPANQIRKISVLQKRHLKIVLETTQEIFATKSMLTVLNFLNACGN